MDPRPLALLCCCAALLACARAAPAIGAVTLSQAEVTHLGVVLAPAAAADYAAETEGYALVLGSDVFAQPLTELITARAAARQSHAAQARMQRLAGTPGADSALARENADRQTLADDAALELAQARAGAVMGQAPPWTVAEQSAAADLSARQFYRGPAAGSARAPARRPGRGGRLARHLPLAGTGGCGDARHELFCHSGAVGPRRRRTAVGAGHG
jgi:hypothetical protein